MLDSLLRILALTRKELLAVLKDRRSRLSLLIPPVVQALIFGYAATYDLNHVTYAVLDQDHSAASRQLLAGLDGSALWQVVRVLVILAVTAGAVWFTGRAGRAGRGTIALLFGIVGTVAPGLVAQEGRCWRMIYENPVGHDDGATGSIV